jgi:hypothetical protein
MRKLILILLLFVSAVVNGQTPAGYIKANMRFKWTAGIFDSALHVPQYNGTPSGIRGGAWSKGGMVGVDTTNNKLYFYSGGSWREAGSSGWSLTGNAGTNTSTNFIGTTDAQPLMFRYNNLNAGSIGKSSGGTYLGIGAGENDNAEDEPNVGVGYYALYYNTTGSANSAVGASALYNNTTGDYNSVVGIAALASNTTGYNNSAVGASALYNNTTGYYNSAVGVDALSSNTTGYRNSAVGVSALYSNTTGYYNSAVGVSAFYGNTTGYYNSAVGASALGSNTTGYYNSAVGASAGWDIKQKPDAKYQNLFGANTYGTRDSITVLGASFIKETIVRGKLIDSTLSAGAGTKAVRWNSTTGEFTYADTTANQGSDVASANNLAVVANTTEITGTTQVNLIANTGWVNGAEINLLLASGITVKNGQTTSGSNITILLDGAADFVTASASMLTLVLSEVGGTQAWREKSRRSY